MVETFADELARRQQDAWRLRRQRIKFCNAGGPLLLRHSTVQYERRWHLRCQGQKDGIELLCALSQHQHLAALFEERSDLGGDGFGPGQVIGKMPEHVLNACCGRQVDTGKP